MDMEMNLTDIEAQVWTPEMEAAFQEILAVYNQLHPNLVVDCA